MSRWWRAYDEALNDPKLQVLGLEMVGAWFNLLCLASKNDGTIRIAEVPFALRLSKGKAATIITKLAVAGLLDRDDDDYRPHNWSGRQYQSDSSAERVKRHRDKRVAAGLERQWTAPKALRQAVYDRDERMCVYCGATENLSLDHRTPEIRGGTHDIENLCTACQSCNGAKRDLTEDEFRSRNDFSNVSMPLPKRPQKTEADNRTEQIKDSCAVAPATRPRPSDEFEEFWKAYPKRDGANPKAPARKAFLAAIKAGTEASEIVAGANACAAKDRDKIGTPYIPQAVKWLRDKRWEDYGATGPLAAAGTPKGWRPGLPTHEELKRKYAQNEPQRQGGEVLESGAGAQPDPQIGRGDQARNGRMVQLGSLFPSPGIQAVRDDDGRAEPDENRGVHGPGSMA